MSAFKFLMALSLALAQIPGFPAPVAGKRVPLSYQLEQAFKTYATVQTTNQAFAYMKVGAKPSDIAFLDKMTRQLNGTPLPEVTLKGQLIYFHGLEKPLAVVDAARGVFSYNGHPVHLTLGKKGFEGKMAELEKIFAGDDVSWFDWILPRARAMDRNGLLGIVSGAMFGGGLAMAVTSMFSGGEGLGAGVGLAALGAIGLYTAHERSKKTIVCEERNGFKVLIERQGENEKILSITPPAYPQQPPQTVPPYAGAYPLPPTSVSPIVSICKTSATTQAYNYAQAAPPVLPAYYPPGTPVTTLQPTSIQAAPADTEKTQD